MTCLLSVALVAHVRFCLPSGFADCGSTRDGLRLCKPNNATANERPRALCRDRNGRHAQDGGHPPCRHMHGSPMDSSPWKRRRSREPHCSTDIPCSCSLGHGVETRRNSMKRARFARYHSGQFFFSWPATFPGIVAKAMGDAHGRQPRWNWYFKIQEAFSCADDDTMDFSPSVPFSHSFSLCSCHCVRGHEQGSPCMAIADKTLRHRLFLSFFSASRLQSLAVQGRFHSFVNPFLGWSNRRRRRAISIGLHYEEKSEAVCAMKCRRDT